jgi:hypothetical protein
MQPKRHSIHESAGIENPKISNLSEKFLDEVRSLPNINEEGRDADRIPEHGTAMKSELTHCLNFTGLYWEAEGDA